MKAKFSARNSIIIMAETSEEALLLEMYVERGNNVVIGEDDTAYSLEDKGVTGITLINNG